MTSPPLDAGGRPIAQTTSIGRVSTIDWLPAAIVAFAAVVCLGGAQGGYFPTSWAPAVLTGSAIVILWLALGAKTDAGWRDAALVSCLALFAVWTGLSISWSGAPAQSILEVQRVSVLVAGLAAVLVLATRGGERYLAYALTAGITAIAGYSLATRLAPGRITDFAPSDYRLSGPIGYWNGLGTFTAMGIVLAFGIALAGHHRSARIMASVALVVLAPTLYFTFSRGAVVALFCGLGVMLAVTPRRIEALGGLALLAPAPCIALIAASHSHGLTNETATLVDATADGRAIGWLLAGLCAVAAGSAMLLMFAESRISITRRTRRLVGVLAASLVAAAMLGGLAKAGGPVALMKRTTNAFDQPPATSEENLNDHLLTFSGGGRVDLWRVAVSAYRAHPALGIGAGSFERYWEKDERAKIKARDAHSLYLETLTELGPIGLAILLAAGAVIVSGGIAARRNPIVPGAFGAFAVYAVHAGVEWDWELTGVTLTAFLAGAIALVALRSPRTTTRLGVPLRIGLGTLVTVVALAAGAGYVGSKALEQSQDALDRGDSSSALHSSDIARRWAPWSPYPLTVRGEAFLGLGKVTDARAAFQSAVDKDPGYWRGWLGLAVVSSGAQRQADLDHASELYRNSAEIYETSQLLKRSDRAKLG